MEVTNQSLARPGGSAHLPSQLRGRRCKVAVSLREIARSKKRKANRAPAGFRVDVRDARVTGEAYQFSLPGWAVNAGRGGLVVSAGHEWRMRRPGYYRCG